MLLREQALQIHPAGDANMRCVTLSITRAQLLSPETKTPPLACRTSGVSASVTIPK